MTELFEDFLQLQGHIISEIHYYIYIIFIREEMEALSWKLISGIPLNRTGIVEAMKNDPIYTAYR